MSDRTELEVAASTVKNAPHSTKAWDELEELARSSEQPDEVVKLYRSVLKTTTEPQIAEMIGERAAVFCDEWFGDDPKVVESILTRVLELAPQSESALQRLSVVYTVNERWTELLGLYDRALEATQEPGRKIKLLREAVQVAKDVSNQPEKAISYLQRLLPLTPDDSQVGHGLERLLERHERFADLIALWEGRLEGQSRKDREQTRLRIAACWLDNLHDAGKALAAARPILVDVEDDKDVCALLERIIESSHSSRQIREAALDLLRSHYDAQSRGRDVIRILERVIALDPAGSQALREEAGARLAELDDDAAAMDHYAGLLAMTPDSAVAQEKLRQLAQRSNNFARYAAGVAAAADKATNVARRVELLADAARTRIDLLDDAAGAIELYQAALTEPGAGEREQLLVCRRLAELYARTDKPRERLEVVARLAALEKDASRRAVLGEAARLAESLGEIDQALGFWQQRLDEDVADLPALDARITLLEAHHKWPRLITDLQLRAGRSTSSIGRRADLVKIATVQRDHLDDRDAAIGSWQQVVSEFGDDPESVEALADLLAHAGRWAEMVALLERSADRDTRRTTERLVRLADALREHLGHPERALDAYRHALAIEATHTGARRGLTALLDHVSTRRGAADALAASYRDTQDWNGLLEIVPARLAEAPDDRTRLALLREAAAIRIEHSKDAAGALADLARAFPMAPRDGVIEGQILDLARTTGDWATASTAFGQAITTLADDADEATRLRLVHAEILDRHLTDEADALETYLAVAKHVPSNATATRAVVRLAAKLGRWEDAATTAVAHMVARDRYEDSFLAELETSATAAGAIDALTTAVTQTTTSSLPPAIATELQGRLARWHRDRRDDARAAIAAFRSCLTLGGDRATILRELAELERAQPASATLLETVRRLADADGRDLDPLVEAADIAGRIGDRAQAMNILGQVIGRATAAWRGSAPVHSSRPADAVVRWAIDALVELQRGNGQPQAAIDLLSEAARLPFDDTTKRELRLRAADIASGELRDNGVAIDMLRTTLAASPDDVDLMDRLGKLLAAEHRVPELLTLKQASLRHEKDPTRRLELRLEIARLGGLIEEKGGRLEALEANLADNPGHDASVDALIQLMAGKGQHQPLAERLEQQASKLEAAGELPRATKLWGRIAQLAERDIHDTDRAVAAHRRVVGLQPTVDSLRALARLSVERGQPAAAVPWYESLLGLVSGNERTQVVVLLARAHLGAGHPDRAIAALESSLTDTDPAIPVRTMLADLYRQSEAWEPLARHLTRSLGVLGDDQLVSTFAREAATIYSNKLGSPARAIPALEKALSLEPTDKELRSQLAVGLRSAGRSGDARTFLGELIADFGRRRSPERAHLHVELARCALAEGQTEEALSEMDQAAKMDASNANIQKELAEMAQRVGQLDKAERTYRALLLVVRRQPPGDDEAAVGPSEVLFELHRLASERGETEQAKELLETAVEAAVESDLEVRRLRRSVLAHKQPEILLRVIETRLAAVGESPSQARLLGDLSELYDQHLDRSDDALETLIKAVGLAPTRNDLVDRARTLAKRIGKTKHYVQAVDELCERLRRKDDPPLVAGLLMKAGVALEEDANDLAGAAALYRRVEMLGERLAEAYFAQARLAGALGDTEEQARTLDAMLQLAGSEAIEPTPAQTDALYRLAEIFIGTPGRRTQGLRLLERAFAAEPRWAQAGRILKIATSTDATDPKVMGFYERVARNSGDNELLLDFLEKRSRLPETTPSQIREAVAVALDAGQDKRAEALLERAVSAARDSATGVVDATWAVMQLAERRLAADQLSVARDLVYEVASSADAGEVATLVGRIAERAAKTTAHSELAAEMYEFLRERNPQDRAVWEPLLALYRRLGDGDRLGSVISSTLPNLTDPAERTALRLQHAHFLIDELQRPHDAVEILRESLNDDADNLEAAGLLERTLRTLGDHDGLAEFLSSRFDDALSRGNRASTVDVAVRLGALLDEQGQHGDAARIYRRTLGVAPDDRDILRKVVAHVDSSDEPREVALLMERLLAVETPEAAPALAAQLASKWEEAGDHAGVQRTLELAHQAAPDHTEIHDRLEEWYRSSGQLEPLAKLMIRDGERAGDAAAAIAFFRNAADVFGNQLGQPRRAAEAIRLASARRPESVELIAELANLLAAGGDMEAAQAAIGEALAGDVRGPGRVDLLMSKANLAQQLGNHDVALVDLEEAYNLDAARAGEMFIASLEQQRSRAEAAADLPAERGATMRLAALLTSTDPERARSLLIGWIERDPRDAEPLFLLRDMDEAIQHWEGVFAACTRLAYVTEGEAQIDAALRAADATTKSGRPGDALPVLEVVHQQQPGATAIRNKLREQYEQSGAYRELANVLLADADHGQDEDERFGNYRRAAEILLYQAQDANAAAEPAQKALALRPDDHGVAMMCVDVLIGSGQIEQAAQTLESSIAAHKKRSPELAMLQQRMARVSGMLGDKDTQLNWLKKAFDIDRKNAEIAAELAQLATEVGDYELALKPLRAITLMDNPAPVTRPMALLWEAKIEHARGNKAKAELWAKKALREDPAYGEAQQFLDELG